MTKRHTRMEVIEARQRNEAKWRRFAKAFVATPSHPLKEGDWWTQTGRFNKLTLSCRDHAICRIDRASRRFAVHRKRFYERLDVADMEE